MSVCEAVRWTPLSAALLLLLLPTIDCSECVSTVRLPPRANHARQYDGYSMPALCFQGDQDEHIFLLGDYGGITCNDVLDPEENDGRNVGDPNHWACRPDNPEDAEKYTAADIALMFATYDSADGPYVQCANNIKDHDDRGRYTFLADAHPQFDVATQMKLRAPKSKPRYVLNGGDNFYFGGIDTKCGSPMDVILNRTKAQFDVVFEKMYSGEAMDVPWFGVLGNHDYGGFLFHAAWDNQIAYTWSDKSSGRWILPSLYWHQHVTYPSKGFSVDYFMIDTNVNDAKSYNEDPMHNLCGTHNHEGTSCEIAGGPVDAYSCKTWFDNLWSDQMQWLDKKLSESKADWQIILTHFTPEWNTDDWRKLSKKHGIDLFVGSHRHSQEVHLRDQWLGGLSWVVIGGGGGITSEWNPDETLRGRSQYGFMDLTLNKTHIFIQSLNERGDIVETGYVMPRKGQGEPTCAHYKCGNEGTNQYQDWQACQCTADCWHHGNCCVDFQMTCVSYWASICDTPDM